MDCGAARSRRARGAGRLVWPEPCLSGSRAVSGALPLDLHSRKLSPWFETGGAASVRRREIFWTRQGPNSEARALFLLRLLSGGLLLEVRLLLGGALFLLRRRRRSRFLRLPGRF